MLRFWRGYLQVRITGASPETCLSRFASEDLAFWDLRRQDELHFTCAIYEKDRNRAKRAALRSLCVLETVSRHGAKQTFYGLRRRKTLLAGVTIAVLLAMLLQNFVWTVRIEDAGAVPKELILRALEAEGVRFGAWGPDIETQSLKNRLLVRLPQLQWISVHAGGCIARVMVAERKPPAHALDRSLVTNVVAARAGIVTQMHVLGGFPAVEPGDAVKKGQLLVSGVAEWTVHTQATRALAEIYAQTFRPMELRLPDSCGEKRYTGRTGTKISLILGRKRIKISDNSSNLGTTCDKIITRRRLTLPDGVELPAELEFVTAREYELVPVPLPQMDAQRLLTDFALREACGDMIAGTVLDKRFEIRHRDGGYTVQAGLSCEELISVTAPTYLFGEGESNGEADQRRTD